MLRNIQVMRSFGIFDDYVKPVAIQDFSDRNIIYGWNYSGKTTISRLFGVLEWKKLHEDFAATKFQVLDHAGTLISDETIGTCNKLVRVFNSDFIENSLKWDGRAFNPILLLGDDSIEAEKKIERYEKLIKRYLASATKKRSEIASIDREVAEGKTLVAKQIKTTLGIVEAFNATHLTSILVWLSLDDDSHILSSEQLANDLKLASTAEKDKLAPISKLVINLVGSKLHNEAGTLLAKTPEVSQIIEYLKNHSAVSDWVEKGLHLHEDKTHCEFCNNLIPPTRLAELHAHFSKDVLNHKTDLQSLIHQTMAAKLGLHDKRLNEFNAQFRDRLDPILSDVNVAITAYNAWLEYLTELLEEKKLNSQFIQVPAPSNPKNLQEAVTSAVLTLNTLIGENNLISENFSVEKINAITRLKKHYAEQFQTDYKVDEGENRKSQLKAHADRYEAATAEAQNRVKGLQATISRAQKGREKINTRIANLLGSNSIQITVIEIDGEDRFQLTRQGKVAKNLSEGEKTAIAFAFFLTKLQEIKKLEEVIVYIDDPISSLDSNHIFQVFSIIKNTFFYKKEDGEWKTSCKQLFVSTHNFEFFSFLRELPGSEKKMRFYLAKRVSATRSTFTDMPPSILKYSSEYHFLFSIIYNYYKSNDKADIELLLSLPNAVRRFVELYTYSKIPLFYKSTVGQRAEQLFGVEKSHRLLKVLHHFSHLESIERLAANTDLISDIETVIQEIVEHIQSEDKVHFDALLESVT